MDVVLSQALFIEFIHSDFAYHTYTHVPNMTRKENAASPRTKKAARSLLIKKCPALTTSEAMKAADFGAEESNDRTIRRRVQRQRNQVQGTTPTSQEPAVDVLVQFEEKNVHFSPLTVSTAGASSSSVSLSSRTASSSSTTSSKTKVDGVKQIRMTAPQKQRDRMNTSKLNDAVKSAFKDATTIYSVERKKSRKDKTKMSAQKQSQRHRIT